MGERDKGGVDSPAKRGRPQLTAFSGTVNFPFVPFPHPFPRLAYVYMSGASLAEQRFVPCAEGVLQ